MFRSEMTEEHLALINMPYRKKRKKKKKTLLVYILRQNNGTDIF